METALFRTVRPLPLPGGALPLIRRAGGLLAAALLSAGPARGESLHAAIDTAMDAARVGPAAPAAGDEAFLRRASLALTGMPPSAAEARAFLDDPSPDKRPALINRLAGSRECLHHLAVQLDVMLMERRAEMHTKAAGWRRWLEDSLAAGWTWDRIVREILTADGSDEKSRHTARWLLERQAEPNLLTRDAGRLFLGTDLGCAQCHDHPRVDDYTQRDYHGLAAFFGRTSLFQPDTAKPALVAEQAAGETVYTSVFTKISGTTKPRLPGASEIEEPAPADPWTVPPNEKDKNVRPIPKQSRRALLGDALRNDPAFRRNIANRLWGMVMGRCLVEPPDFLHSANPPVHPAVLETAAAGLASLQFDLRPFLKELALTKTFAAAFDPAPPEPGSPAALRERIVQLDETAGKHQVESDRLSLAFTESVEAVEAAHEAAKPALDELHAAETAHAAAVKAAENAAAESKKAEAAAATLAETARLLGEAAGAGEAAARPGDSELAAAARTFRTKQAKTEADRTAAAAEAAAKQTAAEAKAGEAETARIAVQSKQPAADAARGAIAGATQKRDAADAAKRSARVAARQASQRLNETRAILAFATATETAAPALAACEQSRAALEALEKTTAALEESIAAATRELPGLEETAARAAAAAGMDRQAMETAAAALQSLTLAAGKAAGLVPRFPGDKEVAAAAALIQTRLTQAAPALEAAQKTLAASESAATAATAALTARREAMAGAQAELAAAAPKRTAAREALATSEAAAAAARTALTEARQSLAATGSTTFAFTGLSPVPPESLSWSILQVTGTLDQLRESAAREWDEKHPPAASGSVPPEDRAAGIGTLTLEKIKPHEDQFVRLFANSAGQPQGDFFATADQVLYFENAGSVRSWTAPGGNNLAERLAKLPGAGAVAEELYLAILTRRPSAEETADITSLLQSRPPEQKTAALSDAIWALLTSTEFRFRH